jgi:tripartite ATP-independent transporter DctM subunit
VNIDSYIGLAGFVVMLVMVSFRVPLFVAMLVPSLAGFWIIGGRTFAFQQFTTGPFYTTADSTWIVLGMFMLMGLLASETNMARDSLEAVSKWTPKLRGSILVALTIANAVFGAVNGSPGASNAVFAKIALPEIERLKYDKAFSLAAIASAGVLSSMIPPSTAIIVTCILVNVSIGKALVAGIIPGIVCMVVFCLMVVVIAKIKSSDFPQEQKIITWRERFSALKFLMPVLVLFLVMIGGIYAGVYPPSTGGAIGAFALFVYAFIRRVKVKCLVRSLWDTILFNGQIFPMIFGGLMFSRFMALSGLSSAFNDLIVSLQIPSLGVMAVVLAFYILMGIVAEVSPILIITLPIVFPILTGLGFDPFLIVIIVILMISIGGLTPPLGMPVFICASVAEISPMVIFKRIWPFFWAQLALCWVFIFFPQLVTWLPYLLYK